MSQPLSYDPAQFLEIAEDLIKDSKYEQRGRNRTSIGRAYYASFLMAKRKLEGLGCSFKEHERIHEQVITAMHEKNPSIADKIANLRKYRVDADYYMDSLINMGIAQKCVKISRLVMTSLAQLR